MPLKSHIQKSFAASSDTYKHHATLQYAMQNTLMALLKQYALQPLDLVLELGCGNGDLGKRLEASFAFRHYYAIDLVDFSREFLGSKICFLQGDFEALDCLLPANLHFSCILSNAALQWSNQRRLLPLLVQKLQRGGILLFSTFGEGNFQELKELFNLGLAYLSLQDYPTLLGDCEILDSFEEIQTLSFANPLEVFRHLQNTGVNALAQNFILKKAHLRDYEKRFHNHLTYHMLFICAKKL